MIERIDERSKQQGFETSRLPKFTEEEIEYIKGTHDYLAINAYTTAYAQAKEETDPSVISYESDLNVDTFIDETWEQSASSWLRVSRNTDTSFYIFITLQVVPWGLRHLLNWLSKTYNHPEIFVTENGVSDTGGLDDDRRIYYYQVSSWCSITPLNHL